MLMPQCAVCNRHVSEELDIPVGMTVAGSPELDPTRGTKRYWEGVWYYFCGLVCRSKFDSTPSEFIVGDR